MTNFNKHVGMPVEESYLQHKDMIYRLANQNKGSLKNVYSMGKEDLVQVAVEGFLKAYMDYNSKYDTKFSTYVHNRIQWELSNALKKRYTIHFPDSFCYIWNIVAMYGLNKTNMDELMKRKPTNMSKEGLDTALSWIGHNFPTSLDGIVSTNSCKDEARELYELVVGSTADETSAIVADFIFSLTDKEAQVVSLLIKGLKQSEIAKQIGHSQPHVSRIIKGIQKQWKCYEEEAGV